MLAVLVVTLARVKVTDALEAKYTKLRISDCRLDASKDGMANF